ncbi:MHC-I-like protein [Equine molluscum contagiosum-like virus]|nr:MHC-I-like protein [Equine molluscum contagiosum-like virus]
MAVAPGWSALRLLLVAACARAASIRYLATAAARACQTVPDTWAVSGLADDALFLRASSTRAHADGLVPWCNASAAEHVARALASCLPQLMLEHQQCPLSGSGRQSLQLEQTCTLMHDGRVNAEWELLSTHSPERPLEACTRPWQRGCVSFRRASGDGTACEALTSECSHRLRRYAAMGSQALRVPRVRVHAHTSLRGDVTLRCVVLGFFPEEIQVSWETGPDVPLRKEHVAVRPAGDGTFQQWFSVMLPSGGENTAVCVVRHVSLPAPLRVRWDHAVSPMRGHAPSVWRALLEIVLTALAVVALGPMLAALAPLVRRARLALIIAVVVIERARLVTRDRATADTAPAA